METTEIGTGREEGRRRQKDVADRLKALARSSTETTTSTVDDIHHDTATVSYFITRH